jgi:hypothetical protein
MASFVVFLEELFSTWWGRTFTILAAASTAATFAVPYFPHVVVTWKIPAVISLVALALAPYDVYKRQQRTIAELNDEAAKRARPELVVYGEPGSRYIVEADGRDAPPRGTYFELVLTIENRGAQQANVRRFDLLIEETGATYENQPIQRRENVRGRASVFCTRPDWIGRPQVVNIAAHDTVTGVLPFYVAPVDEQLAQVHVRLRLIDTEGNVHEGVVTVRAERG